MSERYAESGFSRTERSGSSASDSNQAQGPRAGGIKKAEPNSPTKFLMNVPGLKTIDSAIGALVDGKLKPPVINVWPWSSKANSAENLAQELQSGGLSKRVEVAKSQEDSQSEFKQLRSLKDITRVTATYRACEDQILKRVVDDRLV
jgi:hypothetical protein